MPGLWLRAARAFLVAQLVKNPPAMQETWVRFLGQEEPLEKEMATHSSMLAWRIPWIKEPWQATVHGVTRVRHDLTTKPPKTEEPGAKTGCQNKGRVLSMRTALNTIYCSRCLIAKSCPTLSTLRTAAHQVSLFFTISQSLLKLMSSKLVMSSNHLILCHPLLLPPSIFPSISLFQ